ncbi:acyl carrier protein [bacterium]|jgi:acyl carrier protein|nr:acyl carrier protein [bacterium]
MTKGDVFNRVQDVFIDVFDREDLIINELMNSDEIQEWDSLNHLVLINSIENEFDIKFSFEEVASFNNVGGLIERIMQIIK